MSADSDYDLRLPCEEILPPLEESEPSPEQVYYKAFADRLAALNSRLDQQAEALHALGEMSDEDYERLQRLKQKIDVGDVIVITEADILSREVERLQSREERRKRRPSTPDKDEHFRKLHDEEGKSYTWIAERDALAKAMGLDRKGVINHVKSARRRKKGS